MMINVKVDGIPKAQPRPRAFSRGGKARVYDPGTAEAWKSAIAAAFTEHAGSDFTEPMHCVMTFYMPRPKAHFRTGKNAHMLKETAPLSHTQKPDCDNLSKAVMDCLTSIRVWRDDSQVVTLNIVKEWCSRDIAPGARIILHD